MDLLVDTNLLWKHSLRNRLTEQIKVGRVRAYVPTLVHAERIRQIADQKGADFAIHVIQQLVADSRIELLPFSVEDAEAIAEVWLSLKKRDIATPEYWKAHRFDILLCAVAYARGYILVTDDQGTHFKVVASRMNTTDLSEWLHQ